MKGFVKPTKKSRKRARQRAKREAWRRMPEPSPPVREPRPLSPIEEVFGRDPGGDPVLGAVLGALHRIRQRKDGSQ